MVRANSTCRAPPAPHDLTARSRRGRERWMRRECGMSDLTLGRDQLSDLALATEREWLVTNGIGGYASGSVSGALTRREHGLLVAALEPPCRPTLLLAKLAESAGVDGTWIDLSTD